MLLSYKRGQGSIILRVLLRDLSDNNGSGKTGLASTTASLLIATMADNEAVPVVYTGNVTVETIATLGTYAAPTATKCRFKEVDATNCPGLYEIQFADARFAVASAKSLHVTITAAAADAAQLDFDIALTDLDPYDSVRAGLTSLPNAAAAASGGLLINGSNTGTVTLAALTVSGATTLTGAVSLGSTLGITGTTTLAAINQVGAVSLGATTFASITSTGAVAFGSTWTVTGAITLTVGLPAGERNAIADALLDRANGVETSLTPRQSMRLIVSAACGKVGISGDTVTIRDVNDSANRIVATTDGDGQRTAVTLTV